MIAGCIALIAGEDVDPTLILALGGPPARWVVEGGEGGPDYWLRVWGTRGLLWVWEDGALPALRTSLEDPSWRVREMAARVVARHVLGDLLQEVVGLEEDSNRRVRIAAERAVTCLTTDRA